MSGVELPTIKTPVAFLKQASLFSGESRGIRSIGGRFSGTSKVFRPSRSMVAALRSCSPFRRRPKFVGLHREQPLAKMGSGVTLSFCTCRALKSSQRSRKAVRNSGNESAARVLLRRLPGSVRVNLRVMFEFTHPKGRVRVRASPN